MGSMRRIVYDLGVDALRRDDIERARARSLEERLELAVEMMDLGIELKREWFVRKYPGETEEQIEVRLRAWLARER